MNAPGSLLDQRRDQYGGRDFFRSTGIPAGVLDRDVDMNGYEFTNFKARQIGAAIMFASNEAPSDADLAGDGTTGTRATDHLQDVLDVALGKPLILYWDIKALLGSDGTAACLTLRPNTTIIPMPGCGAIMEPETSSSYMFATDLAAGPGENGDIAILGGIWNGNGPNQTNRNFIPGFTGNDRVEPGYPGASKAMFWFHKCRRVFLRDLLLVNQMVYGILIQEWEDWAETVNVEFRINEDYIDASKILPGLESGYPIDRAMNWDGVHLLGPGGTFYYDRLRGNGDDDGLAINTNEHMGEGDPRRTETPSNGLIKRVFGRGLRISGNGGASIRVFGRGYIPGGTPGRVDEIELVDTTGSTYGRHTWWPANDPAGDNPGAEIGRMLVRGYDVQDNSGNSEANYNRIRISNTEYLRIDGVADGIQLELTDNGNVVGDALQDEIFEATLAAGSATSLVTGTEKNIVSVPLLPGKYMITGQVTYIFAAAAVVASMACGPSAVSATLPGFDRLNNDQRPFGPVGGSGSVAQPVIQQIVTVTAPTTYYLVAKAGFSAGALTAFGSIIARRINVASPRYSP